MFDVGVVLINIYHERNKVEFFGFTPRNGGGEVLGFRLRVHLGEPFRAVSPGVIGQCISQ